MATEIVTRRRSWIRGKTPNEKLQYGVNKEPGQGPHGECWEWKFSKRGSGTRVGGGYGRFTIGATVYSAHRLTWELANGPIPEGLKVLHHCDNPPCCRLEHLFLGTDGDNVRDKFAKGRGGIGDSHWTKQRPELLGHITRGEAQHSSKMTEDKVREMRQLWDAKILDSYQLGEKFGIRQSSAYKICSRQSWKHVE